MYVFDHISFISSWNEKSSDKICRESHNTHFMFNYLFFENHRLWDNVEKYGTTAQATDANMAHVHCMLDN